MAHYQKYLTNTKTGETKLIKSNDLVTFQSKIQRQTENWEIQNQRLEQRKQKEQSILEAQKLTEEALEEIDEYNNILKSILYIDFEIDWEELKEINEFKDYEPLLEPTKKIINENIFEVIPFIKKKRDIKREENKIKYQNELEEYKKNEKKSKANYEKEKVEYFKKQKEFNASLDKDKEKYEKGLSDGVKKYFGMVLEKSEYPEIINLFPEVNYKPESKVVLIDVELPSDKRVPSVKEYKYVASRKEIDEVKMGVKEFENFYNNLVFQICLRTIHEVFDADYAEVAGIVVFNGWVKGVDGRTGKEFNNCIVTLQVTRDEFKQINLEMINPKDCFQHLKSVSERSN